MKILIILLRLHGGVGSANKEIAEALRKKGHKVDILSREDHLKKFSLKKGFLPIRNKVKKLMQKEKYDIIYTQDYSCALPLLFPYPLFFKKHFYASIGVKWKFSLHKVLQDMTGKIMGDRTIVLYHHNKKRFPKAHVVYRGVNPDRFKPLKKPRKHFGWINKFSEMGDPMIYDKVARDLKLKPLSTGKPKNQGKAMDKAYGRVISHSLNIPFEKMNDYYNKCKIFINLATPDAGFNLTWLEAMASGIPIIIGNNNGAGPMLPFPKIKNMDNLEQEIKDIVKNHKKINYRKWIIDNGFTWDKVAEKLLKVFKSKN